MIIQFPELDARLASTPFIDTHEHLVEETTRLRGPGAHHLQPCDDFALLFSHYSRDDFAVAGMPPAAQEQFFGTALEPAAKWRLVAPYWQRARHTGYLQAVNLAAEALFGVRDWNEAAAERVTEAMRTDARPGFYRQVFARAGVECCQVNTLEAGLFCDSQYPDLLQQDLGVGILSTNINVAALSRRSGLAVGSLADWHAVIDWAFATYGPRAVAVKSAAAYARRLDYEDVPPDAAAPLFDRLLRGDALAPAERKALEDHLMRRCIAKATEYGLPVKLHCGYYAGSGRMPLGRVRQNASDLCPLLEVCPTTRFVLMHIGYPYQDEYIALAKHYPNAFVDLCWAWIINPAATARFVKEFLVAAPAHKLFTFGGDYAVVEPIVGHAAIARRGLSLALRALIEDGWLTRDAALELVPALMRGNAAAFFPRPQAAPAAAQAPLTV